MSGERRTYNPQEDASQFIDGGGNDVVKFGLISRTLQWAAKGVDKGLSWRDKRRQAQEERERRVLEQRELQAQEEWDRIVQLGHREQQVREERQREIERNQERIDKANNTKGDAQRQTEEALARADKLRNELAQLALLRQQQAKERRFLKGGPSTGEK